MPNNKFPPHAQDRAVVAARAIQQIYHGHLAAAQAETEAYLRDEFADERRQARDDTELRDA
jgi:hypothetical protein